MKKVWNGDTDSEEFPGRERFSSRLSSQEERKIVNGVLDQVLASKLPKMCQGGPQRAVEELLYCPKA